MQSQPWCERSSDARAGAWRPNSLWPSQWQQRQPPCCSWDSAAYATSPLCPQGAAVQAAVRSAFEIGAGRFQARPDQLLPVGGNACACDPARREQLSLLWAPSRCRLRDFSAAAFCAALGDRTLLLVGDSTMQQLASVLMNGLAWEEAQVRKCRHGCHARRLHRQVGADIGAAAVAPRCRHGNGTGARRGCSAQVLFGHSDTLVARPLGHNSRGEHWLRWAEASAAEVVVLGATAHVYGAANFSSLLHEVAHAAHARPRLQLVWATSTPGGCGPRPLASLPPHTPPAALPFQWGEFRQRDAQARAHFARHAPAVRVLDLEPLHYRVDAHIKPGADCLHMCIPGPLSLVPQLLNLELAPATPVGS